jgi:hypothetical protein
MGKKCQRWVVPRDSAWRCEHDGWNIAVFKRTLLSILLSQSSKHHLFGRKNRLVQPDSLNVGYKEEITDSMCYCATSGHNPRACGAVGERTLYA